MIRWFLSGFKLINSPDGSKQTDSGDAAMSYWSFPSVDPWGYISVTAHSLCIFTFQTDVAAQNTLLFSIPTEVNYCCCENYSKVWTESPCRLICLFTWTQSSPADLQASSSLAEHADTAVTALSAFLGPRALNPLDHMITLQSTSILEQRQKKKKRNRTTQSRSAPIINNACKIEWTSSCSFIELLFFPGRRVFYASAVALKDIKHLFASTWRERPLISPSLARWEIERKSFGRAWHIIFFHSCFSDAQMKEIHHTRVSNSSKREGERRKERKGEITE